ncbi:hypothetical protein HN031_17820 [Nocardioides sp. zg-1308]|uniref:hypothetical protein n=1 Tax=Nocardioides sp. zg-1308 TaxID=2736253 RepID=UPI001551788B|nr:hypothetical protein [Nocardioides sp. zg-1308]NPD06537.1 hypothetical protein [Nocardioides sp. zg-1308]
MATYDQRELPVHLAAELDGGTTLAVLAPAQRWRTLVDGVKRERGDVLLTTVARLTAVGCGALQISEALQLPHDLIDHLVARVRLERIKVAEDGRTLVSETADVGWTYRDLISDDLCPVIGPQFPPVGIRWQGQHKATFSPGTTGNPRPISAVALFARRSEPARPTPYELARLTSNKSFGEPRLRLVGASETCLLVHPVLVVDGEIVVTDVTGRPQLRLTRALREGAEKQAVLRTWISRAVATESASTVPDRADSPLGRAVAALSRARHDFQAHRSAPAAERLLDSVELVLGRYCAETWFRIEVDPATVPPATVDMRSFAAAFGLAESDAAALLGADDPDARRTARAVVKLALESRHRPDLASVNAVAIASLGAEFVLLRCTNGQFERVDRCAREVEDLGRQALNAQEGQHG